MFNKTDATTAPARPATPSVASGRTSVLAADLRISGDVTSAGSIEVLGDIDGTLTAKGLTVGAEGRVTGIVTAEVVEVKGRLDGKVASQSFTLRSTAQVAADVSYTTVVIESGAQIEGRFTKVKA
jgi:cytoskeletal protein CcmA (bactofilin family)